MTENDLVTLDLGALAAWGREHGLSLYLLAAYALGVRVLRGWVRQEWHKKDWHGPGTVPLSAVAAAAWLLSPALAPFWLLWSYWAPPAGDRPEARP